jgi:signal transduction histidine kinase
MATLTQATPVPARSPVYDRLLGETAWMLLQDVDAATMARNVFTKLHEYLPVDFYVHYLVSQDGTHLELASTGGAERVREALGPTLNFGQAVCGTVAQTCEWMHVTNVLTRTDDMTGLIRTLGLNAYTCQPLIVRGHLLGTYSFGSFSRNAFTEEELEIFGLVAEQVSLATDRRRQNEQFLQLEREAASGRLSATLAHEVNNPLESLTNLLYLLRDEVHSPDGSELLIAAESAVARLAEVTQRTLDQVRGKRHPARPLLVHELLDEMLTSVRLPNNVPVDAELQDGLCVRVVPGELRQVVFNLMLNAAHFTPMGDRVRLNAFRSGDKALIQVADNGPGIHEEARAHIFQPYYTTRENGGTGLGLWASRSMMQRIGGDVTFESEPKVRPGTVFTVTLPLYQA